MHHSSPLHTCLALLPSISYPPTLLSPLSSSRLYDHSPYRLLRLNTSLRRFTPRSLLVSHWSLNQITH